MKQSTKDEVKVVKVINSCVTFEQWWVAREMVKNWDRMHWEKWRSSPLWKILNRKYKKLIYKEN